MAARASMDLPEDAFSTLRTTPDAFVKEMHLAATMNLQIESIDAVLKSGILNSPWTAFRMPSCSSEWLPDHGRSE